MVLCLLYCLVVFGWYFDECAMFGCCLAGLGLRRFGFDFVTVYFVFWCYNTVLSALVICFAFSVRYGACR